MRFLDDFAKLLILGGVILVIIGVVLLLYDRLPYIGRLPGDIYIKKKNFVFYFPLATSIVLSILLTLILNIIFRRK
ncbi:MAG: DUF2905 domain-containing protein [Endomicrobia bacterium]|nr:DUF2905 domain-containing protein [Endomicrobiia bacterium]MDW8056479.1 DUF2905 domain-containing protein [Elusimicrobiota bacterium]